MSKSLFINKTDITKKIAITSCVHELYAGGRSDSLSFEITDEDKQFDKWGLKSGATVEYKGDGATTGEMFIHEIGPTLNNYSIRAYSMPSSGTLLRSKVWQKVHFKQIGFDIAAHNGLEFESYGLDNLSYNVMRQEKTPDFKFFGRLCTIESAMLTIYNGKLIAAYEPLLEKQDPAVTIDALGCVVDLNDRSVYRYGSAIVSSGLYSGTFKDPEGGSRILIPEESIECRSNVEAVRFAAGLLRDKNKALVSGTIEGALAPVYAPGINANIKIRQAPSWSGIYYIYRVRHDYWKNKTVLYFRKRLEGY